MAESVADLIYGQIHLYPSEVHLGLLSGVEALDVVLWNATFAPVQLVGVNSASSAGTTLSGFRPGAPPPTGALKGLLTVLSSGPAQQDTTYTFVTGIGERSLTITGVARASVSVLARLVGWVGDRLRVRHRADAG